jgi:hypothetical protein
MRSSFATGDGGAESTECFGITSAKGFHVGDIRGLGGEGSGAVAVAVAVVVVVSGGIGGGIRGKGRLRKF